MTTTWSGNDSEGYRNDTGWAIVVVDGQWCLVSEELDYEGVDFYIPLNDLFNNPKLSVVTTDDSGKIPALLLPNLYIGETFFANSESDMLALNVQKGDVCIRTDIVGGASFRLMGTNPANRTHWAELLSRFANWSDIQNRPTSYPPTHHTHPEHPILNAYGKLPSHYIEQIQTSNHYIAKSVEQMLALNASRGDVCTRTDIQKSFLLTGLAYNLSDWVPIVTPYSGVDSVNGKKGTVTLTPEDIGSHEKLRLSNRSEEISFSGLEDRLFVQFESSEAKELAYKDEVKTVTTIEGSNRLQFYHDGTHLYYSLDNGGNWLPFA